MDPISRYDFALPEAQIAQRPTEARDGARLMVVDRNAGTIEHRHIVDLPELLPSPSLLVVNNSRVIAARLLARRDSGGRVELLLLEPVAAGWRAMFRSSKRLRKGERLTLDSGENAGGHLATIVEAPEQGRGVVDLAPEAIAACGRIPLPPYIQRDPTAEDLQRYQTVYAQHDGSVAAPTAGLHLTSEALQRLQARGIGLAQVTLHVGPGTFVPVRSEDASLHRLEQERYQLSDATAKQIADARRDGSPIVAVGTTSVRTLESTGGLAGSGRTELFIRPGHKFSAVDHLLTNFHLPRSTLLMLVCAFGGRELVLEAYRKAVEQRYRFYSYGDAMLLL